jgi:predicted GNAT family N-acyltransferase
MFLKTLAFCFITGATMTINIGEDNFVVIFQPDTSLMKQIYALRPLAWRARVPGFPDIEEWKDKFDECSDHWCILDKGKVVASARLTIRDKLQELPHPELFRNVTIPDVEPIASINRLVVAPEYGGKGLSQTLDRVRLDHADRAKVKLTVATTFAGQRRTSALEALGFVQQGFAGGYEDGPLSAFNVSPPPSHSIKQKRERCLIRF